MLKVTWLDFYFRAIPEGFLFVFATYAFAKVAINRWRYILASMLLAIIGFAIRFLPIQYGIHTIISVIVLIGLSIFISKFEIIKAIQASIFAFILEFICEAINMIFVKYVLKTDINSMFDNVKLKLIYSSPSLIIFVIFIFSYYYLLIKRRKLR